MAIDSKNIYGSNPMQDINPIAPVDLNAIATKNVQANNIINGTTSVAKRKAIRNIDTGMGINNNSNV